MGANPDCAAGHDMVVGVTMFNIEGVDKTGQPVFTNSLRWLFEPLNLGLEAIIMSPRIVYDSDPQRKRFIVAATLTNKVFMSKIVLAVSKTSFPQSGTQNDWYCVVFDSSDTVEGDGATFADELGLAVDAHAIYVTASIKNKASIYEDRFVHSKLWTLGKISLFDHSDDYFLFPDIPLVINNTIDNQILKSETILSMNINGPTRYIGPYYPATIENDGSKIYNKFGTYLVAYNTDYAAGEEEELHIIRVSVPTAEDGPTFQEYLVEIGDVDDTSTPLPNAAQPNPGYAGIQTGDRKVQDAAWYNEKLYVALTVSDGADQAAAYWVTVEANSAMAAPDSLSVVSTDGGLISGEDIASGVSTYYPSIAVNTKGEVLLGFGASGGTTFSGMYAKLASSSASEVIAAGEADLEAIDGLAYHGEYSGNSVDPENDCFWLFNTYSTSTSRPEQLHQFARGAVATAWARVCPHTSINTTLVYH
jgi:hypothetical protein